MGTQGCLWKFGVLDGLNFEMHDVTVIQNVSSWKIKILKKTLNPLLLRCEIILKFRQTN